MKLTEKRAFELSVIKWEFISVHGDNYNALLAAHPELKNLQNYCGMCERHLHIVPDRIKTVPNKLPQWNPARRSCGKCPLVITDGTDDPESPIFTCFDEGHPFYKWDMISGHDRNGGRTSGNEMLEFILERQKEFLENEKSNDNDVAVNDN